MFRMMRFGRCGAVASLILFIGLLLCAPTTAGAQLYPRRWSADSILVQFERDGGGLQSGYVQAMRVLERPDAFLAATRDSVLDGLERLSLTAANERVRSAAALTITSAGLDHRSHPVADAVSRLTRIYSRSDDLHVRSVIRGIAWRLADREGAGRLLRLILVVEDERQARRPLSSFDDALAVDEAIENLTRFGPEGKATLAELHRNKRLRSFAAKERLDVLARQNFTVERQP